MFNLQNYLYKTNKLINYETMAYLICGVLTTLVDWLMFALLNEQLKLDYRLSTALSWLGAVVFAYVVNKLIVFKNYQFRPAHLWKEWWSFFAARAVSGLMVMLLMIFFVDKLHWGRFCLGSFQAGLYLAKGVVSAVNLVVNYIFSKLWIFKQR